VERHHRLALAGSAGLSAIALTDAVTHGVTGSYSPFADDSGQTGAILVSYVVHGLAYLALAHVLRRESAAFAAAPRVARGARRVLLLCFAVLGVGFLVPAPATYLAGAGEGALGSVWSMVGLLSLLGLLLGATVLGLAVARRNPLGIGGRVLGALIPVLLATIPVGFLAPDWAHPAYLEPTINVGVALLGVGVPAAAAVRSRSQQAATAA